MTPRPDDGLVRAVRAAVLTVPVVVTAGLAHSLAGGCVTALGVFAAAGLTWPGAVVVLGRRRGPAVLLLWLLAAQTGLHQLLSWTCGNASAGTHGPHATGPAMLALHGTALLVTALLLHRADAGLWTAHALVRWSRRLRLRAPRAVVVPSRRPLPPVVAVAAPRREAHEGLPVRRGPPALRCA